MSRVRHVGDELAHLRILAEEVGEVVGAVLGAERLVLAVDGVGEAAQQGMVGVAGEDPVPLRAPQHLDDVPAGAPEQALQLLDDLAVAAHRPVQPLQVAVDDEGEVVEILARRQGEAADRFRLVHLAVAEHAPDVAAGRVGEAAVAQVAHEPRLVDRVDRADAHRAGRDLPEIRHQPGMRIGAQAVAGDLLAISFRLLVGQPAFEEGSRIDARRRVRLEIDQVAVRLGA